ncbi:hypothetical protein [Kordia sp.]|uniref:hypothetical protein n=1 Tax=Kordia sp. TaxID=1965332 RepID=UPI0025C03CA9|nr:hypothetical protein [Kordia sp.]MCH2194102.1 hypothetical protein [Kordia sp.]
MKKIIITLCSIVMVSCNSCPETESYATSCFQNASKLLKNKATSQLDFAEIINCFEWDRLEIHSKSNHEELSCFKFHQVDLDDGIHLGKDLEAEMDFIDGDRHWYFIHFYKYDQLLPEILAINEGIASFYNLTQDRKLTPSFQKEAANFYYTKSIYGGIAGETLMKQRQLIKLASEK